jgi:DNA cross-link repair 1A protein
VQDMIGYWGSGQRVGRKYIHTRVRAILCLISIARYTPPTGQSTTPTIDQILAQTRAHTYTVSDLHSQRGSNARITIYGVPYSEHSSFRELTCFALSVDWARMIATVNVGSAASRGKMSAWFEKWAKARKDRGGGMVEYRSEEYW